MQPARPKGMPRKEWQAMPKAAKARFLDFNIKTTQHNSGVQQYGAGQTQHTGGGKRSVRNASVPYNNIGPMPQSNVAQAGPTHGKREQMRESLGLVFSNGVNFKSTRFPIAPALLQSSGDGLFPWLSKVSANYERYRFHRLSFIYIPDVNMTDSLGSRGRVVLSGNYDALEGGPDTLSVAETIKPNVAGLPTTPLELHLASKSLCPASGLFTRIGPVSGDLKTYDAGNVFFSTSGFSESGAIGELFVDYDVELINPRLQPPSVGPCQTLAYYECDSQTVPNSTETMLGISDWTPVFEQACLTVSPVGLAFQVPVGLYHVTLCATFENYTTGMLTGVLTLRNNNESGGVVPHSQTTLKMIPGGPAQGWFEKASLTSQFLLKQTPSMESSLYAVCVFGASYAPQTSFTVNNITVMFELAN